MLEGMPVGLYVLDREWRFVYANAEAEHLIGRRREDVVGQTLWEAFPAAVGTEIEESYRRAIATGESVSFETYYPEPLNAWYDVRALPGPDGLSVFFLEVSERRAAEQAVQQAGRRLALLTQVSSDLAGALTTDVATLRLPGLLAPGLADGCLVTVFDDQGHPAHAGAGHAEPRHRDRVNALARAVLALPGSALLAGGGTDGAQQVLRSRDEVLARTPPGEARNALVDLDPESVVVVPLERHGRALGVLSLLYSSGRSPSDDDLATVQDIADRTGLALDNARLYGQQRQLAEELQRSLLTEPPEVGSEQAEIVVRYLPATELAAVGGDWYDAFVQDDGSTVLIIGDVAGHDIAAAATMGQLRGLLRGIATSSDGGPAEVLSSLDRSIGLLRVDTMATAAVARFERTDSERAGEPTRMCWSSAGHPPPFMISTAGDVTILDRRPEMMLGVDPHARRTQETVVLEAGTTVLLYTDGLIERRDSDLDIGLARLRTALTELAGLPLQALCDQVLERLVQGRPDDDVAMVAIRLYPATRG
jgi:serine phosphatase RsbU (regulator of sigma subunit)/PAS domain-containing protein